MKRLLRWLISPRRSPLDVALTAGLAWLLGARPHWLATEIAVLVAVMVGIPTLSSVLRRLGGAS